LNTSPRPRLACLPMLVLTLFGVALALGASELALRAWFAARGSEDERILYLYDRQTINAQTAQLVGLPYLNYGLNPTLDDVNERGLRGELVAIPKPDGVFRILALGGSTTYGHALPVQEAWPAQLQSILRDEYNYPQLEVINLGAPGYFSLDSLVNLATRGLAHEPDLILVYDGLNDAIIRMYHDTACYSGDTPLFGMGTDRGIWTVNQPELPPSILYRLLGYRFGWLQPPTTYTDRLERTGFCPPEPQGISPLDLLAQHPPVVFERNLRSMTALAQSADARVVLSGFAWDTSAAERDLAANPQLFHNSALLSAITEQNALMARLAQELDAIYIDLPALMGEGVYFQGDQVHQNAQGTRRQAEVYAQALAAVLE
jgi:lysophospholipase L1-like esterase